MFLSDFIVDTNLKRMNYYTLVLERPGKKIISREYQTRELANEKMYQLISKYNLKVESVYEDHHDYTYNCLDGSKFFIDRA